MIDRLLPAAAAVRKALMGLSGWGEGKASELKIRKILVTAWPLSVRKKVELECVFIVVRRTDMIAAITLFSPPLHRSPRLWICSIFNEAPQQPPAAMEKELYGPHDMVVNE